MFVSLLEMIFAAVVMLVDKRWQTGTSQVKAYVSLFIGVFAVGLPSGIIMWVEVRDDDRFYDCRLSGSLEPRSSS